MRQRKVFAELRTRLAGLDPGLVRVRLAGIGTASMVLAAAVMSGLRALSGQPVTVVLFATVLAMFSNLAVTEPDLRRRRVTTLLMLGPAVVSIMLGTVLTAHRVAAAVAFVAVTMVAVYVRRFGPRGFALGMAAFMPFFFTQFLHVTVAQLPWLLCAAAIGISSTLLLRGWVFAERPERTRTRLVRAFRAHLHALVGAVANLLAAPPAAAEQKLRAIQRRRTRLNETALLVTDSVEHTASSQGHSDGRDDGDGGRDDGDGGRDELGLSVLDTELAAERLAVTTCQLVKGAEPVDDGDRRALLAGLSDLGTASAANTPPTTAPALLEKAKHSVAALAHDTSRPADRTQRVALAVTRLADAMTPAQRTAQPTDQRTAQPTDQRTAQRTDRPISANDDAVSRLPPDQPGGQPGPAESGEPDSDKSPGLALSTRQAVQVGVATSLAIVVGELVSPAHWYWAVITAFVVFAGTSSRGELLNRGWQRTIGTIGGVLAGMGLAVLVNGRELLTLLLLFGCVFLALYLVRISQALLAFWITAVLALLYGLIGQFSVQTLILRIEETAVGAAMGVLAGYLVLPKRTREAFGEALDEVVDAVDAVLAATVDRILGREPDTRPVELAREMDSALGTLRARAKPLDNPLPWRRGRSRYQRMVPLLTNVGYYTRSLARLADHVREPGWAPTLEPAAVRVRANLAELRQLLLPAQDQLLLPAQAGQVRSAEDVVCATEADAARTCDPARRAVQLRIALLLRRIDQAVVRFATDLGAGYRLR